MPNDKQSRAELVERLRDGIQQTGETFTDDGEIELFDIDDANDAMSEAASVIESQASRIEALEAENARLREALTFYRDKWAYTPNKRFGGLEWRPTETLLDDCGNIARSALNPEREEK